MRASLSIFLAIIIATVGLRETTLCLVFKLNQDYFAKNHCVEKALKNSKCKGTCQLLKIVKESKEAPGTDFPVTSFELAKIELFFHTVTTFISGPELIRRPCFELDTYRDSGFNNLIFHPPVA